MRIGLFTDTYCPQINGVAASVRTLKEQLVVLGHQVYIITTTDPAVSKEETDVYRLPSVPFVSERRIGMAYHPRIARLIAGLKLDLIHTHTEFSIGIFGRTMARKLQIPMLHTMHTIYVDYTHYLVKMDALESIAKSAARKLSSDFCNRADAVVVPTAKVKELLLTYGVTQDISVIPTGVDLGKFSASEYDPDRIRALRAGLGIDAGDQIMLYVGRISEEKNIKEILLAMHACPKDRGGVKFLLIGDGPAKEDLEQLSIELNIQRRIIFAGERPWDEIGMYYQLGDMFISASQSETQGLTYIEALAAGLPVVAKADRCLDGVVQNGVNGYTFEKEADLEAALDAILLNARHKERLSMGAVQSSEKFSGIHFAKSVEALYENLRA